jgi:HK97 family phage prohead protease
MSIKAAGEQDGTDNGEFEAIVATYDLDSYGDKIVPGAFKDTLAEWAAKGDPIPVIWSHMSYDPDAHIGVVEEAEERAEGLWVKGRLDLDQPKAAQVYRLLKGRRVTQFSFAYDVEEGAWIEQKDERPYYELRKLSLYEVGPCLIGVNQETELLAVKGRDGRDLQLAVHGHMSPEESDALRVAVEVAMGAKAGRVLSAKNEESLKGALDKIGAGVADVKSVLAALGKDDEDGKAAPAGGETGEQPPPPSKTSTGKTEAKPGQQSADDEEPPAGAKSTEPTAPRPASLRLLNDLAELTAEAEALT